MKGNKGMIVTKFIFGVNEMKKIDNGRVIDIT
jgi:hypothetical protein